ncbi:MAG TPA: DUF2971 domain-containing protein [Edaphobacter sp.]|nr:DUF2971 domain-containing protein [Edaphobacter sp.]
MDNSPVAHLLLKRLRPFRKPSMLYHYTSGAGLIGIVDSKAVWASNIRFLNDSREYELAVELVRTSLDARLEAARSRYDSALYHVLLDSIGREQANDVYVTSFSRRGDQLSQWRAYCPQSGGYAIGISGSALAKTARAHENRFLAQCVYDRETHQEVIEELITAVEAVSVERRDAGASPDRVYREAYKLLGRLMPLVAPILKHASFEEEAEWRLISLGSSFENAKPQFRMGKSTLVPYFQHSLQLKDTVLPIEEVVIGPTPHPDLAREATDNLLRSRHAGAAEIRSSLIPYRAW